MVLCFFGVGGSWVGSFLHGEGVRQEGEEKRLLERFERKNAEWWGLIMYIEAKRLWN